MTAGRQQTRPQRRIRRLIERPRLIRLLDGATARTILLVAPAGYGKTTLARQWARTLTGTIWVASTPSHRDVVTFSEDVAAGVDALGGNASRFIGEYMRARSNPQRAAKEIAEVLATRVEEVGTQWLIVDDYHELAESPEVEEMVAILRDRISARLLIASRTRPNWATSRDVVYGEIAEIGPGELALTPEETTQVIGRRPDLDPLVRQANGWPAVVALAAGLDTSAGRVGGVPATLHRYVAEELFQSAARDLQISLTSLALFPNLKRPTLTNAFGERAEAVLDQARDLGFITADEQPELHPLLREFLFAKVAEDANAQSRVREAITVALDSQEWELALDLVLRFGVSELVDSVLESSFRPLVRSGRLGTLSSFATLARSTTGFPPIAVDAVEAEVALRDGHLQLAADLARRAQERLSETSPLRSRMHAIEGQSANFYGNYSEAVGAFSAARNSAQEVSDETDAIHGVAVSKIYGEVDDAQEEIELLAARRHDSPLSLLRHATCVIVLRRYRDGLRGDLGLSEPLHALSNVEDPRARTAFTYTAANALALRSDYRLATTFAELLAEDTEKFALEFARPFLAWTLACIGIGLRRFGDADRHLQTIEDAAADPQQRHHGLNARVLRARLLLHTGKPHEALEVVSAATDGWPIPQAWRAEYLATRALAMVVAGESEQAVEAAEEARKTSVDVAARVAAFAARAASDAERGSYESAHALVELARKTDLWDPVLTAIRVSPSLLKGIARDRVDQQTLIELSQRADDQMLARQLGTRRRATRPPDDLLSRRELEVLGLMAQGGRNREIAGALFIAESTVKVHVRHIFEKLGVRTRAEAVARYERTSRVD